MDNIFLFIRLHYIDYQFLGICTRCSNSYSKRKRIIMISTYTERGDRETVVEKITYIVTINFSKDR